eukprot:scaffold129435_cov16-Tisochrysis_lutea.AAC.1
MDRDLIIVLCKLITTSYTHISQACSQRAFAKSFCNSSASNAEAVYHVRDDRYWQPESMWSVLSIWCVGRGGIGGLLL